MKTILSALLFVVSWNALAQDEGNSGDKKATGNGNYSNFDYNFTRTGKTKDHQRTGE